MTDGESRRVAIVGNGPMPEGAAAEIDASDLVVRFNHPPHTPAQAGERTDILFVMNSGKSMQARLEEPAFINSAYFRAAGEIILPYAPEIIAKYHPKPNVLSRLKGRRADWTRQAVQAFSNAGKKVSTMPASFYEECCNELGIAASDRRMVFPSTGFIGIRYALQQFPPPEWTIRLYGFGWQGWKRHDWRAEQNWVETRLGSTSGV